MLCETLLLFCCKPDPHWAVIGASHPRHYVRARNRGQQVLSYEKVVNPPAHIPFSGPRLQIPPRILPGLPCELTERVDVAVGDELVHPCPFNGQEAGDLLILFRAGEVYFLVGSVEIAADDNLLVLRSQKCYKLEESFIAVHLVFQSLLVLLPVGEVYVYDGESGEFCDNCPPLGIELWHAKTGSDAEWLFSGEGGHAAVTFLGRIVPICAVIIWFPDVFVELIRLCLRFLQTEDIRAFFVQSFQASLSGHRSYSIDVPAQDLDLPHATPLSASNRQYRLEQVRLQQIGRG